MAQPQQWESPPPLFVCLFFISNLLSSCWKRPWSQASPLPPPSGTCLHFCCAAGSAFPTLVDFRRLWLPHALAFSTSQGFAPKLKIISITVPRVASPGCNTGRAGEHLFLPRRTPSRQVLPLPGPISCTWVHFPERHAYTSTWISAQVAVERVVGPGFFVCWVCVCSFCAWPQSYDHRPSHPYYAGTEHVGFHQPGRYCLHQRGGRGGAHRFGVAAQICGWCFHNQQLQLDFVV